MKTRFLVLALLMAFSVGAMAQEKKAKPTPEQRIEKRVERVQKDLMLDDATAAKFAPIYKEYLMEMSKCRPEVVRGKDLSDEQIKKNLKARMEAKEKAVDVEKKYFGKLEKVLNAKQLQKVFSKQDAAPKGNKKQFAKRGKRDGKGFVNAKGRKGAKMNACELGGCKHMDKMAGCKKTECRNECKQAECAKADCKQADCKKECKKADCKKADCKKDGCKKDCKKK
jgi:hypothetical protein